MAVGYARTRSECSPRMFSDRTNWNLATNRLSEALARHRKLAKPLFDLTTSNPTECGFDYDTAAILYALGNGGALTYQPAPKGLETARRAVVGYYAEHAVPVDTEDVILTTSTSEAYSFVFRTLCNPWDELLVPTPSYPLFDFLAGLQDVKLVPYPLLYDHGWQIDFHALESSITPRTRAVMVVHPNNPTGHFTDRGSLAKLNSICSANRMALVADEVFLDFAFAEKPASFAANRDVLTFTLSGLSKIAGLPQMKVAWLITSGPEDVKSQAVARLEVIADTYLSMNAPVQHAVPAFLDQRRHFQPQLMARARNNLAELDRQLAAQEPCTRLKVDGGWYAVLRIPATRSDEDVAVELLTAESVYVHPGHFYDFPADGFLVVSLITRGDEFAEGVKRLLSFVGSGGPASQSKF
jgi:alanine-synthesizing transaminase